MEPSGQGFHPQDGCLTLRTQKVLEVYLRLSMGKGCGKYKTPSGLCGVM